MRETSTSGRTAAIAAPTRSASGDSAAEPISHLAAAARGNRTRTTTGEKAEARSRFQPRKGLAAKPAQRTKAMRFAGLLAAYRRASGVEKDSATSTNGPAVEQASATVFFNSE
jgi:hypothetical protein